ncbi:MAG TPA: CRISPR-associated endonuclease Cas2 [Thermofilum sp.]|nr:CRISPR-associated endonuclease Cas2 [Thermofilum sp.]
MHVLVIYDISDDGLRFKISELCKDFGLLRIQKSAFLGPLTNSRKRELVSRIRSLISYYGSGNDNVQVFALDSFSLRSRVIIGKVVVEESEGVLLYV